MIFFFTFAFLFVSGNLIGKYSIIAIIFDIILLLITIRQYKRKGIIISIICILIGVGLSFSTIYKPCGDSINTTGCVINSKENYYLFFANGNNYYVYEKANTHEQGDLLKIKGKIKDLEIYKIESEFDFETYLNNKGVYKQISVESLEVKLKVPIRKKQIINSFLNSFKEENRGYIKGLLFSNIDYQDSTIKNFILLNVINTFSISGIFVYLLFSILEKISEKFIKNKFISHLIPIIILLPYCFMVISKIGILRVFLLKVIKDIAIKVKAIEKLTHLGQTSIVGILLIFLNPRFTHQSAFYLGFFISIMMYFFRKSIKIKSPIKSKIFGLVFMYILLIPISAVNRNEYNLFGMIYHYLFLGINLISFVFGLITLICPFLRFMYDGFASVLLSVLSKISFFKISIPINMTSPIVITIYYSFILLFLYFSEIRMRRFKRISLITSLLSLLYSIAPYEQFILSSVNFINIGQGDACLIRDGSANIMIDVGGNLKDDLAVNSLIPYFNKNKIHSIDAIFISHYDYDHYGSLDQLKKNYKVKNVYDLNNSYPIKVGSISFDNINKKEYGSTNDNSVVLYFKFIGYNFLFTGDIGTQVEEDIIKDYKSLNVDILKVAHHGSINSYSESFIKTISPKEAVISSGKNNYNQPHPKIIALLEKYKVKVRLTVKEGTITYKKLVFNI